MHRRRIGFTLIELMIAVAIIGILAAITYPAYQDQIRKSRRSDGIALLTNGIALQERYFTDHNTYTVMLADLGYTANAPSEHNFYQMSAVACGAGIKECVQLTAVPQGAQATDGNLVINSTGTKTRNGKPGWD
ncbi:MAG: type IV pilin protein [Gammaproteobacteria bacterium]|nr:type IV pilin protein [Gammaproteobacteria bacterium]